MFNANTDINYWKRQLGNDYVDNGNEQLLTWTNFELIDGIKGSMTVWDNSMLLSGMNSLWCWEVYGDESLYNSICKTINSKYNEEENTQYDSGNMDETLSYYFGTTTDTDDISYKTYITVSIINDRILVFISTSHINQN
jgi:hypothetical protein